MSTGTQILIVGAGAVGAFYASRLAQVSHCEVSVICRSNFNAVKANGFSVSSPQYGSYSYIPTHTFPSPETAKRANITWDYVVVSTKALPDVSDDSIMLQGLISEGTSIVLIQNGLGIEEPYAKRYPQATILSAVTIASAAQTSPGVIEHNRWTRTSIGPYFSDGPNRTHESIVKKATERNSKFVDLLQQSGIKDAENYDHAKLQLVRWHKIAINASMNPSAVLAGGATNYELVKNPDSSAHVRGVMDEVLTTAPKIIGQPFPKEFATPGAIIRSTQKNTSGSKPSMLLDWEQGKKMELEVILGNPVRIAKEHNLEMPRLQAMYRLLKMAQERRERKGTKPSSL